MDRIFFNHGSFIHFRLKHFLTAWMMSSLGLSSRLGAIRSATILEEFSLNASTCFECTTFESSLRMGDTNFLLIKLMMMKSTNTTAPTNSQKLSKYIEFDIMLTK